MGHREPDACPWLYVDGIGVKTPHSLVASTARQPREHCSTASHLDQNWQGLENNPVPIQLPRVIEGGVWIYDLQPPGPLPLLILPTSNGNGAPPSPPTGNRSGAGTFRLSTPILGAGNRKGKSTRYQTRCPPLPMVRHWLSKRFPQETLCRTPRAWNIGTE